MFHQPGIFTDFLERHCLISKVYDAMDKEDTAEVVLAALDILVSTGKMPSFQQEGKSDARSDFFRTAGNDYISRGNYSKALECYNKALLCAPKNSRALKLAYSNRSFVLFKLNSSKACIEDIDKCFSLGCPPEIKDKLLKRKAEASERAFMEAMAFDSLKFSNKDFFSFPSVRNTNVSCASNNIKIEKNGQELKILAAREVDSGTIIASEEAYMTYVNLENRHLTCYYCLQLKSNLIPCDNCCYALFCSEECKIKCFTLYHKFECPMMALLDEICHGPIPNLMIKTLLKLKSEISWKEFIRASKLVGNKRIKVSSIKEIFDNSSKWSILSFKDDRPFVYGVTYNACFVCAVLLHHLSQIPSFLPSNAIDKVEAMRALARTLMYLSIHGSPNFVFQVVTDFKTERTQFHNVPNYAWYSFYGKIRTACTPNVIPSFLNHKVVLIAIRKIQPGEEITTAILDPLLEDIQFRNVQTFLMRGTVCTCSNCQDGTKMDKLSQQQKDVFNRINIAKLKANIDNMMFARRSFIEVCQAMNALSNVPHSKEYKECFKIIRSCQILFEAIETQNFFV